MQTVDTRIGTIKSPTARFFAYATERHKVYLRRRAGQERPWTKDPILQRYRFTNVYRELDRVTEWCKQYVRSPYDGKLALLPAVVLFRWFNRIETGEVIFCQADKLRDDMTPFETWLRDNAAGHIEAQLRRKGPPWVTGAYTVGTRGAGGDKLSGVLNLFETWAEKDWKRFARRCYQTQVSLQEATEWLQVDAPNLGPFMAYEVACDLRWTAMLGACRDARTWCNIGPGAQRGMNRVWGATEITDVQRRQATDDEYVKAIRRLLGEADDRWPTEWPRWEMREVEHTLCEFDKYERVRLGQGRPRGTI